MRSTPKKVEPKEIKVNQKQGTKRKYDDLLLEPMPKALKLKESAVETQKPTEQKWLECDTLFYPGMLSCGTQALKYVKNKKIFFSTNQFGWCEGRNGLAPINVIYNLFLGPEIADVDLNPYKTLGSYFNPLNWVSTAMTYGSNRSYGFKFETATTKVMNSDIASPFDIPLPSLGSVAHHGILLSKTSMGQETDCESHLAKYEAWKESPEKKEGLISYCVSRGTATGFNVLALNRDKYKELKLLVLEGAIDSVPNVMESKKQTTLHSWAGFFKRRGWFGYDPEAKGMSPLELVDKFPENLPVVFITSELDKEVPMKNTLNIANKLAERGKNEVHCLILKKSSHPRYMFDDREDRDNYERFMHAIYRKYGLQHDATLAKAGQSIMEESFIDISKKEPSKTLGK